MQVLLVPASEDGGCLQDFEAKPGTRSGLTLRVFVPFRRLCGLANRDAVLAIRQPARAMLWNQCSVWPVIKEALSKGESNHA